jgi:competence protein ComEC
VTGRAWRVWIIPVISVLLTIATIGFWIAGSARPALMTVTFLDVGQGDATVLRTPNGSVLLVDCGGRAVDDDQGRRVVLPYLRSQGINRIDALVLTHPDEDHTGGALSVLAAMPVGRLLVSRLESPSGGYARILEDARRRSIPVSLLVRGMKLASRDGVVADVLNPPPNSTTSENDASIVLTIRFGENSLLLLADAEAATEEEMRRSCSALRADVLKLGHHGSITSSSEPLLDVVRPAAAIVSAGPRNPFGHPHPIVLKRLAERNVRVFRTDRVGAVIAVSNGKSMGITTMLSSAGQ